MSTHRSVDNVWVSLRSIRVLSNLFLHGLHILFFTFSELGLTEELTRLACQQGSETAATALSICSDAGLWIVLSRWFSGFPRQSNNPPSHMFDSSQPETTPPWFCPPHLGIQLSQAICSSPIPKPSSQVRNLCRKLLQAEQYYNSIWSHHDYEAENSSDGFHPLADLHYPGLEERALWSEYNSWLVGLLVSHFKHGSFLFRVETRWTTKYILQRNTTAVDILFINSRSYFHLTAWCPRQLRLS